MRRRALSHGPNSPSPQSSPGFTLLELMVALAILITVVVLVASIYANTLNAWKLGQSVIDELHQGDFVMEQVVGAIRSSAFFPNNPKHYGFVLDDRGDKDKISFVTSSSAFIPSGSPYQNSLHRLFLTVDSDAKGREGLAVRALPHMTKELEERDAETWVVSSRVEGFDCRVYDFETKDWTDTWEDTNKVPSLVMVTLTIKAVRQEDPPLELSRVIELPIAPAVSNAVAVGRGVGAGSGTNRMPGVRGPGGRGPGISTGGATGGTRTPDVTTPPARRTRMPIPPGVQQPGGRP